MSAPRVEGPPGVAGVATADPGPIPAGGDTGRSLVRGGGLLAVATLATNAGNYAVNIVLGRWLTPAEFADATLMVTLMLTLTAVALCLQLVAAREVARGAPAGSGLIGLLRRRAAVGGVLLALVIALPAPLWQELFRTGSPWPFVVLAAGVPCYLAQAVGRGVLQGGFRFGRLSVSLLVEMAVRFAGAVAGVALGFGVVGATVGLSASFVATWLVVRGASPSGPATGDAPDAERSARAYALSVGLLALGQIVLMNGDVLVAKASLLPYEAGIYAAVALVGRAVFFVSWVATTVAFPAAARRHAEGRPTGTLLAGGAGAVAGLGLLCTGAALVAGGPVLGVVLGPDYAGTSAVLAEYALITTMFAVANFVASHRLSTGRTREAWVLLGGAVLQTVLLLLAGDTIADLVRAQLVAVTVLLVATLLCRIPRRTPHRPETSVR